jgi:hypothetical protein
LHFPFAIFGQERGKIAGNVTDPQGNPISDAKVLLTFRGSPKEFHDFTVDGTFVFEHLEAGTYTLKVVADGFEPDSRELTLRPTESLRIDVKLKIAPDRQSVTVTVDPRDASALAPDPAERVLIRDETLDANPGHPGAPVSLPGLPIETASGGIKAPQYFAPGVAGDHGEPIAQFYQIGNFLYPNNLPANAHGNGYADPNFLIAPLIEAVTVDGGAFNVREGNHSIDLAATYVPRQRLNSFVEATGDYRDIDLVAAWSPRNSATNGWLAAEAAYGNGFLQRLEHRQQYKLNGSREYKWARHDLTLFGVGYYGFSFVPGLIPIHLDVPNDTVDNRQLERTNTVILVASDTWSMRDQAQLTLSAFFRDYNLTLRSNFSPDYTQQPYIGGLIQQSESRTVVGGGPLYTQRVLPWLSILGGIDLRRDAPRGLDLRGADPQGAFHLLTSNDLTLSFVEPYAAVDASLGEYLRFDAGVRREEVWMNNVDRLNAGNSFDRLAGLTLPKATLTILPSTSTFLPTVAFSYGEAFHTEDPRIGNGTGIPTLLSPSRAYQMVMDKTVAKTELRLTLKHVTNSQELAKIDPDTGLQEDVGPSLNRSLTLSAQHTFSQGSLFVSYSQADARERLSGAPVPEAPRFIWDTVVTANRLPFQLKARAEFEYVRAKPLGDGFVGVAVPEFRGAVLRPFHDGRVILSTEFLIADGYTGQTTEVFAFPTDPTFPKPVERIVGVPLKSCITFSFTYRFAK